MRVERSLSYKCIFRLFLLVLLLGLSSPALATNGLQFFGYGPVNLGYGGAGVAKPESSNAIIINPAGMNALGNQVDLSFQAAFPASIMGTSLAAAGNPDAVMVGARDDAAFLANGSSVLTLPIGNGRISFGAGAIFTSGFQVDFPVSRFNSSTTGNVYDRSARYANLRIVPSFSVKIIKGLTIGAGLDIGYAFLHTDTATLSPGNPETMGRSRFDSALGIGGRIGIIYVPIKQLQIGGMYVFRQRFQPFTLYTDFLSTGLDNPRNVVLGVTILPFEGFQINTDFKWINWANSGVIGRSLAMGGAGWRDQYVFAGGASYNFDAKTGIPLIIRAGFNYGRSPITSATVFRNILIPTVMTHHVTAGLTFDVTENTGFDGVWFHEFANTVTDDGTGNPLGRGSFVGTNAIDGFSVGFHFRWGAKGNVME